MNIFVIDYDPVIAGSTLQDAHIVKMPLESAQMACTAAVQLGGTATYKPTHRRHPCVLWIGRSSGNARWALAYGIALFLEYEARYDRRHKSLVVFMEAMSHVLHAAPCGPMTEFIQVMPDRYRGPDPVEAYRSYYLAEKMVTGRGPATWRRNRPEWANFPNSAMSST